MSAIGKVRIVVGIDREMRLPQWAQKELQQLRNRVQTLQGLVDMALPIDVAGMAKVTAVDYSLIGGKNAQRIHERIIPFTNVRFRTSAGRFEVGFANRQGYHEGSLDIRSIDNPGLIIKPRTDNSAEILVAPPIWGRKW